MVGEKRPDQMEEFLKNVKDKFMIFYECNENMFRNVTGINS